MPDEMQFMTWLVDKRAKNQKSALVLYELLETHREVLVSDKTNRRLYQTLLGVNFSLWRAVFLANIGIDHTTMIQQAEKFLKRLIETNMIAFGQDFEANHWTYRYYLVNARDRLKGMESANSGLLEKGTVRATKEMEGKPLLWWEDLQSAFEAAVNAFDARLVAEARSSDTKPTKRRRKAAGQST